MLVSIITAIIPPATAGWAGYDDDSTSGDYSRHLSYYSVEGQQNLSGNFFAAARYSAIDAPQGYPLAGQGDAPEERQRSGAPCIGFALPHRGLALLDMHLVERERKEANIPIAAFAESGTFASAASSNSFIPLDVPTSAIATAAEMVRSGSSDVRHARSSAGESASPAPPVAPTPRIAPIAVCFGSLAPMLVAA